MTAGLDQFEKGKKISHEDPLGALNYFQEALEFSLESADERFQMEILLELCVIHRTMSNVKDGFSCAAKVVELAQQLSEEVSLIKAYNYLGIFCYYSGLYKRALNYFYDGIERCKEWQGDKIQVSFYTNIGETYKALGSLNQSLSYFERAYGLARTIGIRPYYTPILCNLGDVYMKKNDFDMAMAYFNQADEYRSESVDKLYAAELEFKKGILRKHFGEYEQALIFYNQAEANYRKINHKFYLFDVLIHKTELSPYVNGLDCEVLLNEARRIAVEITSQTKMATIEYKLHELAIEKGDYKLALEHFKEYHEYAARADAQSLLSKLEIMNIEQTLTFESERALDLQDFANMEIFSNQDMEAYIQFLHKDLQFKAYVDELTGLANRRKINEKLKSLQKPCGGKIHGLLLIDIDHFKLVNDSEGHLYGDRCLMRVAKVIREWAFPYQLFTGRYGGEEFLCVIENIKSEELVLLAEEIRQSIEQEEISYQLDGEKKILTVSVGCSIVENVDYGEVVRLLDLADRSLYMAKSAGRNRIMVNNFSK